VISLTFRRLVPLPSGFGALLVFSTYDSRSLTRTALTFRRWILPRYNVPNRTPFITLCDNTATVLQLFCFLADYASFHTSCASSVRQTTDSAQLSMPQTREGAQLSMPQTTDGVNLNVLIILYDFLRHPPVKLCR
jgi:hypothetical protein